MRNRTTFEKCAFWLFGDRIPATKIMILIDIITFLAIMLFKQFSILIYMGFDTSKALALPWTFFTYPLVTICGGAMCMISTIFAIYWLWWAGGSLERSWGTARFCFFFFTMSALSALGIFIGSMLSGKPMGACGLWLPLAGVVMAFAMLNPEEVINFNFLIPLKLKYLALIDAATVLIMLGFVDIRIGLFALSGCAFAYLYATKGRHYAYASKRGEVVRLYSKKSSLRSFNPAYWFAEYRDRKRLKNLLK